MITEPAKEKMMGQDLHGLESAIMEIMKLPWSKRVMSHG